MLNGTAAIPQTLSKRELEVLRLVAQGYSNRQIGRELCISARTVGFHVENILRKLAVQNRAEAAAKAMALGYLEW